MTTTVTEPGVTVVINYAQPEYGFWDYAIPFGIVFLFGILMFIMATRSP